jgi:alpha-beta hydrolase superfamily lysophospholipase
MEKKYFQIQGIPAILWGSRSNKVYLYIHGQAGHKEEAEAFARIACRYAWQVLSIDLPEHGERKGEANSFDPWHVVPELLQIMDYIKGRWTQISLFANSIGAWFGMLSFENEPLEKKPFYFPYPRYETAHLQHDAPGQCIRNAT